MLIEQLATTKHLAVERFYRTLYESLLDHRLITTSKHALYLNLLFRALRADLNIKRVKAFAKRLLQVVTLHEPPFICGAIYLLRELEVTFPGLKTLLSDPEMDDDDEEVFRDVPEDGEEDALKQAENAKPKRTDVYDGRKRDPEHSNADKSCLWEAVRSFPISPKYKTNILTRFLSLFTSTLQCLFSHFACHKTHPCHPNPT